MMCRANPAICALMRRALATAARTPRPPQHGGGPLHPAAPSGVPIVFDRAAKALQRNRAATAVSHSRLTDYLKDEVARRLVDRILDIKKRYPTIVDVGCGAGHLVKFLDEDITQEIVMCDSARDMLYRDADLDDQREVKITRRVLDEERELGSSFPANSLDIIVSNLSMHWINDLPGFLIQARHCLKEDGVFIGAMLGGDTLFELRTSMQLAELEREGGVSPRISPMTIVADMGSLLGRAGYNLTTVDVDDVIVDYPSMFELIDDLKGMGESNAVVQRRPFLHRDTLAAAAAIYRELHGNPDGSIPATFQVIYLIGWKPAASQAKPLERGSGKVNLREIL